MPSGKSTGEKIDPARQNALYALMLAGYTREECCRILHIGAATITALRKKRPPSPALVEQIKKNLVSKVWETADRANNAISDDKLEEMNAYQLATIQAIQIDKALLLEGRATHIVDIKGITKAIDIVDAEIVELEKELRLIEDHPSISGAKT